MNVKNKLNLLSGTDAYEVLQAEEVMAEALEYIEELENLLDEQGGVINSQQKMLNAKSDTIDALNEDIKRYHFELSALHNRGYQEERVKVDKVISYPPVQLPPGWGEILPKGWNDYKC